jgi:hypothetical protein
MKPFVVSFGDWLTSGADIEAACFFNVSRGELRFPVSLSLSGTLGIVWRFEGKALQNVLLKMALGRCRDLISSEDYPKESTHKFQDHVLTTNNSPEPESFVAKYCRFQAKSDTGPICKAAARDDPRRGRVSQPLCEQCTMPDSRLVCSHLSHPTVISKGTGRLVADALCEKGSNPADANECVPGSRDCWELTYEPGKELSAIPNDLAARVSDEIDFLNLAFKEVHRTKILTIHNARSVSDLHGRCETADEFMNKVAILADLTAHISVIKLLPEELRQKDGGSIDILSVFLKIDYPGQEEEVTGNLRLITKVRNSFPIHSRTEGLLTSFDRLGIDYPPNDWDSAWKRVLNAFYLSLKNLRRVVMTNPGRKK